MLTQSFPPKNKIWSRLNDDGRVMTEEELSKTTARLASTLNREGMEQAKIVAS